MEDQQPDSGDLTTDAAAAEEGSAPRRRHRLPLQKERRALQEEQPEAQDALGVDETDADETPEADESTSEPRRRRWNFLRRRKNQAESVATETVPAEETSTTDAATRRTPVGKAGRSTKQDSEPEAASDEGPVDEAETVLVAHQPAGKRLRIAAAAAAALFVAGGAFAGATAQPVLADRALVDTKLDIARTAQNAITTLWTYTPENMNSLADRSARYLTGDFASEYRKFIDSIVATNKQAQVTNSTSVLGTAVESVTPSEATAVVYTNSVATSPVTKNIPSLRYLSYRLSMKRDDADWRVTRMTTVTMLDLTPQL